MEIVDIFIGLKYFIFITYFLWNQVCPNQQLY